jgi:hypothetical protein
MNLIINIKNKKVMKKIKEKLAQYCAKVSTWWNNKSVKSKQIFKIVGCCLGMVLVFFGLIYIGR